MKAVIVDIKQNSVVALNDEGCMVKIKNNNYQIGQVIELKKRTNSKFVKSVSAAIVLLGLRDRCMEFFISVYLRELRCKSIYTIFCQ